MRTLGRYQLVKKLATGGMAELWLARMEGPGGFEKHVALKVILPHLADDPRFLQMLLTEARLAAKLNHPNIVHIFDLGAADGSYYLAMELVDGLDCRGLIRESQRLEKPIPLTLAAKIVALGCEGLHFAHNFVDPVTKENMSIVHRDMSSDNLLVSRAGAVKVIDFGVAKLASNIQSTKSGQIKGKFAYTSPEQFRGEALDGRTDVFSLGMILYELVAGRKPFDSMFDATVMQAVLHEEFAPLKTFRPEVPDELQDILNAALAKKRDARFKSCLEFARDLEGFITWWGEPVSSVQIGNLVVECMNGASVLEGEVRPSGETAVKIGRPDRSIGPEFDTLTGQGVPKEEAAAAVPTPRKRSRVGVVLLVMLAVVVTAGLNTYWFDRPLADRAWHGAQTSAKKNWPTVKADTGKLFASAKTWPGKLAGLFKHPEPPAPSKISLPPAEVPAAAPQDAGSAQVTAPSPSAKAAPVDAGIAAMSVVVKPSPPEPPTTTAEATPPPSAVEKPAAATEPAKTSRRNKHPRRHRTAAASPGAPETEDSADDNAP